MLKQSAENNQREYNIRFSTRESPIEKGDRVYVKRMQKASKFDSQFVGPFRVLERNTDNVLLKNLHNSKNHRVHLSHVLLIREDDVESIAKHNIQPKIYPDIAYDLD